MPFVYSAQMFLRYLRVWIFPFLFGGFLNRIIPWWFRPEQNNLYGIFFDKSETSNRLQEQIVLTTYKIKRCSSWCLFSYVTWKAFQPWQVSFWQSLLIFTGCLRDLDGQSLCFELKWGLIQCNHLPSLVVQRKEQVCVLELVFVLRTIIAVKVHW